MKYSIAFLMIIIFSTSLTIAGESGVILNGKSYVLYKDGKKVAELPQEIQKSMKKDQKINRNPSSFVNMNEYGDVYYYDDGVIRCYTKFQGISCIKRSE